MNKLTGVYIAAIVNATIVGLSFMFTKVAIEVSSPMDTLGYRFLIAWIALTLYRKYLVKDRKKLSLTNNKSILSLSLLALFYPVLFFSFQAFGVNFASSAEGGIILAFSPALTSILAFFFLKEKINMIQLLFISLSISGVVYIFYNNGISLEVSNLKLMGIGFLIISCISLSGYAVISRYLSVSYTPIQLTYVMVTLGLVFFNGFNIVTRLIQGTLIEYFLLITRVDFTVSVLFLGVLATFLTSYLSNYILSKLSATNMSIFSNLSTIISISAGALILNEEIYLYHIIGSFMIIMGVLGTNLSKRSINESVTESKFHKLYVINGGSKNRAHTDSRN
ncbi:DMT family transporter [Fredinandcohnia sp. 179-A 10B2 NHS]|uniref:DMT family transporter n=1 Tax=Fredinandcohnia sp. 179-A 10B2 NHS TaxID=3235176 RepID=UPI00399F7720